MKKLLATLLSASMLLGLCACGGGAAESKAPEESKAPVESKAPEESQAAEPADPMAELVEAAKAEGSLVVYGSCEEEYLAAACEHFQELYGIQVQYQRLSTGEVQSKIEEENGNPSGDVWFGGTTDPYNVAAKEGLLEPYSAINASHLLGDQYKDADGNWYGIYKGILGFMVNSEELERMGIEAPRRGHPVPQGSGQEYPGLHQVRLRPLQERGHRRVRGGHRLPPRRHYPDRGQRL